MTSATIIIDGKSYEVDSLTIQEDMRLADRFSLRSGPIAYEQRRLTITATSMTYTGNLNPITINVDPIAEAEIKPLASSERHITLPD